MKSLRVQPLSSTFGVINQYNLMNSHISRKINFKKINNNNINNNNNNNNKNNNNNTIKLLSPSLLSNHNSYQQYNINKFYFNSNYNNIYNNNNNDNNIIFSSFKRSYSTSIIEYIEDLKDNILEKVGNFDNTKKIDREFVLNKGNLNYYFEKISPPKKFSSLPPPPIANQKPHSIEIHNTTINDPYDWLRNLEDPKVIDYIESENKYKDIFMKTQIKPLSKKLKSIFKTVFINHPSDDEIINGFKLIIKDKKLFRQRVSDDNTQLLLSEGDNIGGYNINLRSLVSFKFSEDNSLFSFVTEIDNSENKVCIIKRISNSSSPILDVIKNVSSIEWGKNNELFYSQYDLISRRTHKIFKKTIKNHIKLNEEEFNPSELMIHETNPSNFLDILKSKDNEFLFYMSNCKISTLIYYTKLIENEAVTSNSHKIMLSRVDNLEYYAEHNGDEFYIFANANKGDLNIYKAKDTIENGKFSDLELFISSDIGSMIRDVDMYQNYLVISDLHMFKPRIRIIGKNPETNHFDKSFEKVVTFPQEVIELSMGVNSDYRNNDSFCLSYCTPTENITPIKISLKDGTITKLGESKESGPLVINPENFETKMLWVPSKSDSSIKIPLSIVYNKEAVKFDGNTPCILHGYGSYGAIYNQNYNIEDLFLLNAGFIVARAHVRGGSELGRNWYNDGKLLKKKNTFYDYIDCVEYLFENKYTSSNYLIGRGSSAGGLLMCNVALNYPHYFSGIISQVPFADVLTTMLDHSLALTIHEYDEWGNPNDLEVFNYIKQYDPYSLLDDPKIQSSLKYLPNLYITGSTNDFRVPLWQPLKWVAKLRNKLKSLKSDDSPLVLLGIDDDSGHFGPSDRNSLSKKWSFDLSFIFYSIKKSISKK
ncbi:hypothetical protein RB653_003746 [Dictyostelium firmibasis]|uniref:Prolyl endopeptidase n=1 Tax=Dictyostelium firmibasis TaxID=79012 RepID=A0AAN7U8K2_9MYCE